jgi:predicted glycosyltransferase
VITELFPFGRKKFAGEILPMMAAAKARNPGCLAACSVRDILVEKRDGAERDGKIAALVNERFDLVLVHSDPAMIRLEETFSQTEAIQGRLLYTGFVADPASAGVEKTERRPEVLVSLGGALVGAELALAVLEVIPELPQLLFRFVLGPYRPPSLQSAVEQAGAKLGAHRVRAESFLPNFEEELSRVSLSISLAGYNTVMNILSTRTPALVFPHRANREQILRAEKLAQRDLLRVLNNADLNPAALRRAILQTLDFQPSNFAVNLRGAENTCALLASRLPETEPEAHR